MSKQERNIRPSSQSEDPRRESGLPGGGQGRTDEPGRTGIWPGSGPWPAEEVPIQQPGSFGQGERGAAGYEDSGSSSLEAIQASLQAGRPGARLVRDIMTGGVTCARPEMTLQEAAERMRDLNVGPLPVCGENDHLVGFITDRDITIRGVAAGKDPRTTPVREVMTPDIVCCWDDQTISDAAQLMEQHQVRRLAVLDRNQRLVGILSLGDLAVRTQDRRLAGEAIEAVSEPAHA